MSPSARSVNAVRAAPRWYFGRRSDRRREPKTSPSVSTMTPSAGIANPVEHSPTTIASVSDPVERVGHDLGLDLVLAQNLAQVLGLTLVGRGQPDAEALDAPAPDLGGELVEPAGEARDLVRLQR